MDVALSKNGLRVLRTFFYLVVAFLYARIAILLLFSFNDSELPTFPLSGFTFEWYRQFATNPDLQSALWTSAKIAALSSVGAVALGVLESLALVRRFRGQAVTSALLLSPLVIPYVVFGVCCSSSTGPESTGRSRRSSSATSSSAFRTRSSCSCRGCSKST